MGNKLIHFNTCAISCIISSTNAQLYKMFDFYKAREVRKGRGDSLTFIIGTDTLSKLMSKAAICPEGMHVTCTLCTTRFCFDDITGCLL